MAELRTGPWNLSDLSKVESNGKTVFSCFHCGGGSTMGYKLAGYNVLGGVEIDPEMMRIYRANHHPKHSYLMGVQQFKKITDLPEELFNLDILDGSPPCSSFSMAGSREKAWGKNKKFREGQAEQVLDDLFFEYIAIAKKLRPKIVVAENVKGLVQGNAKGYVKMIFQTFRAAGYSTQLFLLNAAAMGVPQRRERTFFIARRDDLGLPKIELKFNEPQIAFKDAVVGCPQFNEKLSLTPYMADLWSKCDSGKPISSVHPKGSCFNMKKIDSNQPTLTLPASFTILHGDIPRYISTGEAMRCQTFPDDYAHVSKYLLGMSVPPFMMQRVADQIYKQLLS